MGSDAKTAWVTGGGTGIGRGIALLAALPATAHVSELIMKPRYQAFV